MSANRTNRAEYHDTHPLANANRLQQRENWVDEAIRQAQERGEFDNLAGSGKPQEFSDNPHGADWESGFRVLKNAGMAPYWIEVDKEIRTLRDSMTALVERTAAFITEHQQHAAARPAAEPATRTSWRSRLTRLWDTSRGQPPGPASWDLEAFRQRARREFLHSAADLDRKIVEYNNSLPDGLWWKERQRYPQSQAEQEFDTAIPPIGTPGTGAA